MDLRNKKWSEDKFNKVRAEVLTQWPTGKGITIEDGVAYQKTISDDKRFGLKLKKAKATGDTLIQPRAGVALPEEHIVLLRHLEEEGGADLLPSTIDSYTRLNRYQEAEIGIKESRKQGRSMLNGFPAVNWGVEVCRQVTSSLKSPVQVRHGTPDARLLAEITYVGGFTSFEGGGISYNIPYSKNYSLEQTIRDWQYIDRLTGIYEEQGINLNREPFGPLTGTLVPPCISTAVAVLEALLAAEQGVRDVTVGYGQCGNIIQDVAAIKALEKLTEEYLEKFGYKNVVVTTVLHQWMGGFPADEAKAFGVISWGAAAAALSRATKVIVKTPHEAMGIPTKEANAAGLKASKQVISMLREQDLLGKSEVEAECDIICEEVRCILDKIYELGNGDFAVGSVRGFEAGVIDIPFAPSRINAGKLMPVRDNNGSIRLLDCGNLPFTADLKKFHAERIEARAKAEKRAVSFQMVVDDIYAIGNGNLVGRPNGR